MMKRLVIVNNSLTFIFTFRVLKSIIFYIFNFPIDCSFHEIFQ